MRLGIIDLGTNSVRFDVHSVGRGGRVRLLHREKLMIRLGQGVFLENRLDPTAMQRTLQAFISFRRTAHLLHTERVIAFGTSALREADDAENLVELIRKKTQIDIRVISGEEEAQLIAAGILANEQPLKGRFGLIDIGGGSTEISICKERDVVHSFSFPLGAARLQQLFLLQSPPRSTSKGEANPILAFRRYVKGLLLPKMISEEWPKVPIAIGSSGTIRAIERILRKTSEDTQISRRNLEKLVQSMGSMSRSQLLQIPGMEAKRVDIILSGALLLEECMKALGTKEVITTGFSLRDGILDREIRLLSHQPIPEIRFQLEDLYKKAALLGCEKVHSKQVILLSELLFDRTRRIHKLQSNWKRYLSAAAILHDVGKSISQTHHENHSYYIVKNADFLTMEKWESEFIAQLCLKHNSSRLTKKDIEFTKDKAKKTAFVYLLAILRVSDALDRGYKASVQIQDVTLTKNQVKLTISSKGATDLEILRMEQKKTLFESVFQRQLIIEKR